MTQHRIKRTDQEWFDLIIDYQASRSKVCTWCEQHGITAKTLYYHTRRLRQKGYAILGKNAVSSHQEKQEVVCLGVSDEVPAGTLPHSVMDASHAPAVCIDLHGIRIGISNHAAQETVQNTFRALQQLC